MIDGTRFVGALASVVVIAGLAAYGAKALAPRQSAPIAGISGGSERAAGISRSPVRSLPRTDQEVADKLGLTPAQMARFKKHDAEKRARNAGLRKMKSGHFQTGAEINKWWNDGLKAIFTREQYARYCEAWGSGGRSASGQALAMAYSPSRPVVGQNHGGGAAVAGMAGSNPADAMFGGQEKAILARLGLTVRQKARIDDLYARIGVENRKLRELWKGTDPDAVGVQGSKINRMQNEGMKAILTPTQHAKYMAAWGRATEPFRAKGGTGSVRARVIVDGNASGGTYARP